MAEKRGSKNAIENRGAQSVMICDSCGEKRNPYKLYNAGKMRMVYECKCGILDKTGEKV